ncbi:MAG: amino acid ABC transporter permease [Bifidobacteriaceae bacterium]|jgi:polar amino acid transport system permease protein|nr:amino acid ABC transporter permease [Bifidobacteriaceae bacterium]
MSNTNNEISPIELERRSYRKKQVIKSTLISIISLIVLVVVIIILLKTSAGWETVKKSFFNQEYFLSSLPVVFKGLLINIKILCIVLVGVIILAPTLAIIRTSKAPVLFPLRIFALVFTTIMRGTPILVLLYLIGFGVPGLHIFKSTQAITLGSIALILAYSAFVSEVIRSGIESIHPSQIQAARSLGLSARKTMALIILPQAIRKIIPALMNDFISLQKDVGLVSVLGIIDAVRSAQIEVAHSFNFTPYVVAAFLFILFSLPFIALSDWYNKKIQNREINQGGEL